MFIACVYSHALWYSMSLWKRQRDDVGIPNVLIVSVVYFVFENVHKGIRDLRLVISQGKTKSSPSWCTNYVMISFNETWCTFCTQFPQSKTLSTGKSERGVRFDSIPISKDPRIHIDYTSIRREIVHRYQIARPVVPKDHIRKCDEILFRNNENIIILVTLRYPSINIYC